MEYFFYLFFAVLTLNSILNYFYYLHMFQLNSYQSKEHLRWMKKNVIDLLWRHFGSLLVVILLVFFMKSSFVYAFASAIAFVFLIFALPKEAKKKLVMTPRAIRLTVTAGLLFFIPSSMVVFTLPNTQVAGIVLCVFQVITLILPLLSNLINKPIESVINNRYINEAKNIIHSLPNLTVIGITGSYGKTSTKFFLGSLLSEKYNVLITPESYNTTMGVVKTVRGSLNATHDIFVCEMGAKGVGEIKEICEIVNPKHSMITSIGPQHLETFGSIENIIKTKFEIADWISDGTVFLNYDNEYIQSHQINKNTIYYGIGYAPEKSYWAQDITVCEDGTEFYVYTRSGESMKFTTKLLGEHNVLNITGAIAIAHTFGLSLSEMVIPIRRLESVPHRMQILPKGNSIIIDDAFNSNPTGAKAALDTLSMFKGLRILVTPGMVELGEKEFELNKELGTHAATRCDYAVLVGEKQAIPIKEGLLEEDFPKENIFVVKTLQEGLKIIDGIEYDGKKIILLENDLPDNY